MHEQAVTGPAEISTAIPSGRLMSVVAMETITKERADLTDKAGGGDPDVDRTTAAFLTGALPLAAAEQKADVVVYGGTPCGIAAAVMAARAGAEVILVEPTQHERIASWLERA